VQTYSLQIARAPGKNVVYFGFALLIAGVSLMLCLPTGCLDAGFMSSKERA
jgi:cytochrome c biogenesis protein